MTTSRNSAAGALLAAVLAAVPALAPSPALAQDDTITQEELEPPLNILPSQTQGTATGTGTTTGEDVEIVTAATIGSESFGTLGDEDGGLGTSLWSGSRRALLEAMVGRLRPVAGSPALADLGRRLLLTAAPPPDGPAGVHWLGLRIDQLAVMGHAVGDVPGAFGEPAVALAARRNRFQALMARGDEQSACAEADVAIKDDEDPLWARAAIYCQLRDDHTVVALLGLDVLEASGVPLPPSFVPLARGSAAGSVPELADLAGASVIEAAMAGALGLARPGVQDPWAIAVLARSTEIADAERLTLAEQAAGLGALSVGSLTDYYDAVTFDTAMLGAPLDQVAALDGPMARALLHQAARGARTPESRAEAITAALDTARFGPAAVVTARAFAGLVAELAPSDALVWFAPVAVRALIADDRAAAALVWWRLAEDRDAVVAAAMEPLWPLARLAELDAGEGGAERMNLWWQRTVVPTEADAAARAALAAALLLALGDGAGAGILAETAEARPSSGASPALLAGVEAAALDGRVGEAAVLALVLAADGGPEGAPADAIVGAVRGLALVGLDDVARRLAIETAIAHGL